MSSAAAEQARPYVIVGGHGGVYLCPTVSRPLPFAAATGPALLRPALYKPHSTQPNRMTNRNTVHSEKSNHPYLPHGSIVYVRLLSILSRSISGIHLHGSPLRMG